MSTATEKTVRVKNADELRQALNAGYEPHQLEIDPAQAVAEALAAAKVEHEHALAAAAEAHGREREAILAAAHAQLLPDQQAATLAERERILSIQRLTPKGFEGIAAKAIEEGLPVAAFSLRILAEQQDRGITLDAIRRDAPEAAPYARPGDDTKGAPGSGKHWSRFNADDAQPKRM